jgi:MFS family permease
MISDLYPVKIRGYVLAWFYMAIPVGSALGFVLGGIVAGAWGWPWAFYVVVPPGLLLGLWCFFMREPPRGLADRVAAATVSRTKLGDYLILLRTPSYVLNTLGMAAMTFAVGGIAFWMPDYIHVHRGQEDLAQVNILFGSIVVVSGLAATLLGGLAGDKLRPRYPGSYFLVSGVAMLLAFPFSLAMLYVPFPWAWLFIFLACFCLFFNTGPTNTILANVTHPSIRATGFALNIFIIHALGDVPSPLLIGLITDRFDKNMNIAFLVVSAMILVGGLLWLCGTRYLERDTALAPTRLDAGAHSGG